MVFLLLLLLVSIALPVCARDVEYFTVSSSLEGTYKDLNVRDFMRSLRDKIISGQVVDFNDVETELHDKLEKIVKN